MSADIFARNGNNFAGSFAADAARVVFANQTTAAGQSEFLGVGLITQQMGVQYNQSISRLYEIGTNNTYLVAGRTQGQVQLSRVLGPRAVQLGFYTKYGNVCNAASNNLNFEADTGCPQGSDSTAITPNSGELSNGSYVFGIHNAVITSLGIDLSAGDMVINEQLAMMFVSLTAGLGN